jgi:hypothetical protein
MQTTKLEHVRHLIGITGNAGTGKDTVGSMLAAKHQFYRAAFAQSLRMAAVDIFQLHPSVFDDRVLKESKDSYWNLSPREMLQLLGTEAGRKVFGPDVWIKSLARSLNTSTKSRYVITDVRFKNEIEWILDNNGHIIHLTRDGCDGNVGIPSHASEQKLDLSIYPKGRIFYVDNNNSLIDLAESVDSIFSFIRTTIHN